MNHCINPILNIHKIYNNTLLSIQLQIKIDGPSVPGFNPQQSVDYFLTHSLTKTKSGKMRRKRVKLTSKESHTKFGQKSRKAKFTPIFHEL